MAVPKENEKYSYKDYLSWPEGERWELLGGVAYSMSPAPSRYHQKLIMELAKQIANFLTGVSCDVYTSPIDVKFSGLEDDKEPTILQPDIVVVCDEEKLTDEGITGAPDFIAEVISPSSGLHDRKTKYDLYEYYGVREYWIVDPDESVVEIYLLDENGKFQRLGAFGAEDSAEVNVLPGLEIDLSSVFTGK